MRMKRAMLLAGAIGLSSAFGAQGLQAAENSKLILKPLHGVSFAVGKKRTISYFLQDNRKCRLMLIVCDIDTADADVGRSTPSRLEVAINAGETARLDAPEGNALEYRCGDAAQTMSVQVINQVAFYAPAR